jgi:Zn-dependent peptidase ImmA (M78 family)
MNFSRFKEIIIKNREHELDVKKTIQNFNTKVFLDGDIPKVMREIGKRLDTLIVEIPMKDSDFGACYLATSYSKYLLLNSNQPRSKMYFSFCHDVYHILNGTPDYINEKREVHFNQEYFANENESKANLFAANLLMPEVEFEKMFNLFIEDFEKIEYVIVKLMNYFNSPFMAVLIRLFELQILKDSSIVKELLDYDLEKVEALFDELWLDKEILEPSLKDEMGYLVEVLKKEGQRLVNEDLLSEVNLNNILQSIETLYASIRVSKDE